MPKPNVIVLSGYGLNCEHETRQAFELAGAGAEVVHLNDLIAAPERLSRYQILALPGGFAFGDDTGSGNAFAGRLKHHLSGPLAEFVNQDKLVIGICNGFQIISNLGLVPAIGGHTYRRSVALTPNDGARYLDRWVDVAVAGDSPWTAGLQHLAMPIAHGEGRLFAEPAVMRQLQEKRQVALRYVRGPMCEYQDLPANPNGSLDDIAGITDETGRVLGLMPHPERSMFFTQLPNWPVVAEGFKRRGQALPDDGPGLAIFRNAVRYFVN